MKILYALLFVVWVAFWIYWFISAASSKRNVRGSIGRFAGVRFLLLIFVLILLHTSILGAHLNSYRAGDNNIVLASIGFALVLLGLAFAIWARLHLGKNWGMPMSLKRDPELVTSGPYSFVRHPIYTGILLATIGSCLVGGLYWLIILLFIGFYFIYSAIQEEKNMQKQFPKVYPAYKARTKMLIPFVL